MTSLIEKNNDNLLTKTTLMINDIIPKNQEKNTSIIENYIKTFCSDITHQISRLTELTNEIKFLPKPSADLDQWIPVENGEVLAHNGSGDLISWSRADGLVWQKAGDKSKKLPYIPLK